MSDQAAEELQFERDVDAPEASVPTCAACARAIPDAYFEVVGKVVCPGCRDAIVASRSGGSKLSRFLRATLYGLAAAVAGFAIYFGVLKIANLEIGLISILVGFMVGKAVRKGSDNRGGRAYQFLALFLTYSAIAASYSAVVIPDLVRDFVAKREAAKDPGKAAAKDASATEKAVPAGTDAKKVKADAVEPKELSPIKLIVGLFVILGLAVAFAYALPIISGFSSPIGLLIVGFALWEAWKLNRHIPLVVNGPFTVGKAVPATESAGHA